MRKFLIWGTPLSSCLPGLPLHDPLTARGEA